MLEPLLRIQELPPLSIRIPPIAEELTAGKLLFRVQLQREPTNGDIALVVIIHIASLLLLPETQHRPADAPLLLTPSPAALLVALMAIAPDGELSLHLARLLILLRISLVLIPPTVEVVELRAARPIGKVALLPPI